MEAASAGLLPILARFGVRGACYVVLQRRSTQQGADQCLYGGPTAEARMMEIPTQDAEPPGRVKSPLGEARI